MIGLGLPGYYALATNFFQPQIVPKSQRHGLKRIRGPQMTYKPLSHQGLGSVFKETA